MIRAERAEDARAIRTERADDARAIHAVHEASFPTHAEAALVDALRRAGRLTCSLVAEVDGRIVGHVALSPVSVDGRAAGLGLGPVAVLEGFRRQGFGAALIRQGLRRATESKAQFVVVLGDPAYYSRFGFRPAAALGMLDEYGGGDAFQVLLLQEACPPSGLVRYAPEFAACE